MTINNKVGQLTLPDFETHKKKTVLVNMDESHTFYAKGKKIQLPRLLLNESIYVTFCKNVKHSDSEYIVFLMDGVYVDNLHTRELQ